MASFRQRGGKWQARVLRDGYPHQAKTFESRADAERWARTVESSIDKGQFVNINEAQRTTLGDVIERYLAEVTPTLIISGTFLGSHGVAADSKEKYVMVGAATCGAFLKELSAGSTNNVRDYGWLKSRLVKNLYKSMTCRRK